MLSSSDHHFTIPGRKVGQGVAAVLRGDTLVGGCGGGEGDQLAKPRVEGTDDAAVHAGDERRRGEVDGFAGPGGEFGDLAAGENIGAAEGDVGGSVGEILDGRTRHVPGGDWVGPGGAVADERDDSFAGEVDERGESVEDGGGTERGVGEAALPQLGDEGFVGADVGCFGVAGLRVGGDVQEAANAGAPGFGKEMGVGGGVGDGVRTALGSGERNAPAHGGDNNIDAIAEAGEGTGDERIGALGAGRTEEFVTLRSERGRDLGTDDAGGPGQENTHTNIFAYFLTGVGHGRRWRHGLC